MLVLGDNIFGWKSLPGKLLQDAADPEGAVIFAYAVSDPERYGVGVWSETFILA